MTSKPHITILYASQTGCTSDVARRINRDLRRLGFSTTLSIMDQYPIEKLPQEHHVLFFSSTTGQGQIPDNMTKFWNFLLRSDLPSNCLKSLRYSIFGLGDRAYPLYNAVARRLDKRLQSLGAQEFCTIGLGDDQHQMGYDGGLILWQLALVEALLNDTRSGFFNSNQISPQDISGLENTLINAVESAKASLADAVPESTTTNISIVGGGVSTGDTIPTTPQTKSQTDYLAFSTAITTVIKHDSFSMSELDELCESPMIQELIFKAIFFPILGRLKSVCTTHQYERLMSPDDALLQLSVKIFCEYIGQPIDLISVKDISSYHQIDVPDLFSLEKLVDNLMSFFEEDTQETQETQKTQENKNKTHPNPFTLSQSYKSLPIISSTSLTAPDHFQSVNHIQYDLTPLLPKSTQEINLGTHNSDKLNHNNQTENKNVLNFKNLITNPPYLPGDVLEIVPPSPNILVNTLLTLYNLSPNDLILIHQPTFPKTTPHNNNTQDSPPHYHLFENSPSLSDFFFNLIDEQFRLDDENTSSIPHLAFQRYDTFPLCIRAWNLFTWYVHITLTPQRHHFLMLAQQSTNPSEKERLVDFCSASFASTLDSYCIRERRSITEVFADFPSSLLPLNWVIELCDRIKPRQFSLSSSPLYNFIPGTIGSDNDGNTMKDDDNDVSSTRFSTLIPSFTQFTSASEPLPRSGETSPPNNANTLVGALCLATVKYKTPFRRQKHGLCSSYLDVLAYCEQNNIKYHDVRNNGYTVNYHLRDDLFFMNWSENEQDLGGNNNAHKPSANNRIIAKVKPGSFRYEINQYNDEKTPVLAVAPGTGIAAIHAIVEHRFAHIVYKLLNDQKHSQNDSSQTPKQNTFSLSQLLSQPIENIPKFQTLSQSSQSNQRLILNPLNLEPILLTSPPEHFLHPFVLLFGCRSSIGDHFYRDFFNIAVNLGVIDEYHAVFSRYNINPQLTVSVMSKVKSLYDDTLPKPPSQALISNKNVFYGTNADVDPDEVDFGPEFGSKSDKYVQDRLLSNKLLQSYLMSLIDPIYIKTDIGVNNDELAVEGFQEGGEQQGDGGHSTTNASDQKATSQVGLDLINLPVIGGKIIVAGNAKKMPVDVQNTIVDLLFEFILEQHKDNKIDLVDNDSTTFNVTRNDVKKYINIMAKRGRYILECWM